MLSLLLVQNVFFLMSQWKVFQQEGTYQQNHVGLLLNITLIYDLKPSNWTLDFEASSTIYFLFFLKSGNDLGTLIFIAKWISFGVKMFLLLNILQLFTVFIWMNRPTTQDGIYRFWALVCQAGRLLLARVQNMCHEIFKNTKYHRQASLANVLLARSEKY